MSSVVYNNNNKKKLIWANLWLCLAAVQAGTSSWCPWCPPLPPRRHSPWARPSWVGSSSRRLALLLPLLPLPQLPHAFSSHTGKDQCWKDYYGCHVIKATLRTAPTPTPTHLRLHLLMGMMQLSVYFSNVLKDVLMLLKIWAYYSPKVSFCPGLKLKFQLERQFTNNLVLT